MKKELISIGAHCPNQESKKLLLDCLKSLQSSRDKYNILVVSHPVNSPPLKNNVAVQYFEKLTYNSLAWGYGCIQSINVEKLNPIFLEYNKETLLKLLSENLYKTCESITEEVYLMDGESIYKEELKSLTNIGCKFNLSRELSSNEMDNWVVPYYNRYNNNIEGLVWNNKFDIPIKASFIINDNKIISFNETALHSWQLKSLGNIDEINTILIIVNDKIKLKIDFNTVDKELFKIKSYFLNPEQELKTE